MEKYLAIGIADQEDLFVWSEEFESSMMVSERREAAIAVLQAKMPDSTLCRVLIVKNDNVVEDFNVE